MDEGRKGPLLERDGEVFQVLGGDPPAYTILNPDTMTALFPDRMPAGAGFIIFKYQYALKILRRPLCETVHKGLFLKRTLSSTFLCIQGNEESIVGRRRCLAVQVFSLLLKRLTRNLRFSRNKNVDPVHVIAAGIIASYDSLSHGNFLCVSRMRREGEIERLLRSPQRILF